MRLLLVAPMPPDPTAAGAIPRVLHAQLNGLSQRHEVSLLVVAGPEAPELAAVERLRASGVNIRAVQRTDPQGRARWSRRWRLGSTWLRGLWPWRTVWYWDPGFQAALDEVTRETRFDVVQVEDNAMGVYRYPGGVPVVLTEHEARRPRPFYWRSVSARRWLAEEDWRRWKPYQRSVWGRFARLLVFSARDAQTINTIAPGLAERIRITPFGVDLPPEACDEVGEGRRLLFVGNFTHQPNVDAALWLGRDVMPRLRATGSSVDLMIVGIHPPADVRQLAAPDIAVLGAVADLDAVLQQASIVVAPVRTGGGMRMKVLHAMACGKAVVTTSRGAQGFEAKELVPPLVVADDVDGITKAIMDLLADRSMRQSLGVLARDYVAKHYSPDAYARRLEAVYAELC